MKTVDMDLAIIGGGPAGLAAAIKAKQEGIERICILERDIELGGILQQCIHDGFGLQRFKKRMSGTQYAEEFIKEIEDSDIEVHCRTMVLNITKDKTIYAVSSETGMTKYNCKSIILAMGCRERTRNQVFIYGSRPSGVMTAGAAQRYINIEGYLPGKKAVILGSGDIGLIMARRMTLEGMEVEGVYEVMEHPGGLSRNIVQCLDDYNIPLHLATTVTQIHGKERVEAVTVAEVDSNRDPIKGTERKIECDLLILAVGLIPENELTKEMGIEIDPKTSGPIVDENFMTSIGGVFAAGNVVAVFDLVDYVSYTGEFAARGAAKYLSGQLHTGCDREILAGNNVNFVVPQKITSDYISDDSMIFLRVKKPDQNKILKCTSRENTISEKKEPFIAPPEMLVVEMKKGISISENLTVGIEEA